MSREYQDDGDDMWGLIRWRGAVDRAILGKRGQALLKDVLHALNSMTEKKLIRGDLERDGRVCALGAVGKLRGVDMHDLDPEDADAVAHRFGVAPALVREIGAVNDKESTISDEARFRCVRDWLLDQIPKKIP